MSFAGNPSQNSRMPHASTFRGFTLLELAIALAVGAVIVGLGVPGLGAWARGQELQDLADALLRTLDLARSEAIRRAARVDVCPGGASCAGGATPWEGGWSVVADVDRDRDVRAILRERAAAPGITISGNRPVADYVSYTSAGHARRFDGALQMGTFTLCRHGERARKVILANSGRARIEATTQACP